MNKFFNGGSNETIGGRVRLWRPEILLSCCPHCLFGGVVDTGDKHSFAIISANFRKNSKRSQWDTQRPGGHWLMKKTWSRNSRVRLPLSAYVRKSWSSVLQFSRSYKIKEMLKKKLAYTVGDVKRLAHGVCPTVPVVTAEVGTSFSFRLPWGCPYFLQF